MCFEAGGIHALLTACKCFISRCKDARKMQVLIEDASVISWRKCPEWLRYLWGLCTLLNIRDNSGGKERCEAPATWYSDNTGCETPIGHIHTTTTLNLTVQGRRKTVNISSYTLWVYIFIIVKDSWYCPTPLTQLGIIALHECLDHSDNWLQPAPYSWRRKTLNTDCSCLQEDCV